MSQAPSGAPPQASGGDRWSLLFILPTLHGGGAERVVLTILRHLDRSRFDLTLAVLDTRDPVYSELPSDVRFVDLGRRRVRDSMPSILRLIRQTRPHVVFSVIAHLNLAMALMKPLFPRGVRLVARETAVLSHSFRGKATGPIWHAAYRWLCRRFDQVVCQSEAMRAELVDEFGLPPDRAYVIRNPVDLDLVARLAEEPLPATATLMRVDDPNLVQLVAAGRLSPEKGFDLLVEAMSQLRDSRYRLTILGDGPERAALEGQVRDLGVEHHVQLLGFQANPYCFFARASALVVGSRSEAFPNVALEALACGAPVIATPAPGGLVELLRGRPGCVIVDALDASALARAIATYPFGKRHARLTASLEEYAAERVCEQYASAFDLRSAAR